MRLVTLAAMLLAAAPAFAQSPFTSNPADVKPGTYALDPSHGKITWSISHLGFSTYIGQFGHVTGTLVLDPKNLAKTSVTATVEIVSVGTLNPKLDSELKGKEFFDAAAYPTATFKSTSVTSTGANTANVAGNLTLLGVTKPVTLAVTFNLAGVNPVYNKYDIGFEAHTVLTRSQFGLKAYVPYVGDAVTLDIEAEFGPKA